MALVLSVGCGSKETEGGANGTGVRPGGGQTDNQPPQQPPQPPPPSTPAPVTQEQPPLGNKPPIEARAKAELDGKDADANWNGNTLAVTGGRAAFVVPTAWQSTSAADGTRTAAASDGKAKLGAGTSSSGVDAASHALGLTECTWNPSDNITLGKDKLAATTADGVCMAAGNKPARAVQVILTNENVAAVGAWDVQGGDSASVFSSLRAAKKASGGGGNPGMLDACCSALSQNAVSAPLEQKGYYLAAAGVCNSMKGSKEAAAVIAAVAGALKGASMPAICR